MGRGVGVLRLTAAATGLGLDGRLTPAGLRLAGGLTAAGLRLAGGLTAAGLRLIAVGLGSSLTAVAAAAILASRHYGSSVKKVRVRLKAASK